jgi:CPA1 family monovalent cation:H+ antiporter
MNYSVTFQEAESIFLQLETAIVVALTLITFVAIVVKKVKIPYTVALVLLGLALTFVQAPLAPVQNIPGRVILPDEVAPDEVGEVVTEEEPSAAEPVTDIRGLISGQLILALLVPPLIFEGALHIRWRRFRKNLLSILLMALPGVLLATVIVAGVILSLGNVLDSFFPNAASWLAIPIPAAIAFGALISATDPVAVIAFFRTLGVSKRLAVLVEGESLLNDGTSIVIFNLALALGGASVAHGAESAGFDWVGAVVEFGRVAIGGLLVGIAVGAFAVFLFRILEDRLVETMITLPVAFGSFILAEHYHLSGILAVVAAGILVGNAMQNYTSPSTKTALFNFWEMFAFVMTSLIFLIIGWQIDIREFIVPQNLVLVGAAVLAILISRAIVVYGMSAISSQFSEKIPVGYRHVMYWGGLRGAISLALALSLAPNTFGAGVGRQLQLMTFGVVLFTLLAQGLTIEKLIGWLKLAEKSEAEGQREYEMGRFYAARAARKELDRLHDAGILTDTLWQSMRYAQDKTLAQHDSQLRDLLHQNPGMGMAITWDTRRAMLSVERAAVARALREELISEHTYEHLLEEIQARQEAVRLAEGAGEQGVSLVEMVG